jgi:RNA-directed DNA polymerase
MNELRPPPVLSMQRLAWTIGVPIEQLKSLADDIQHDRRSRYKHFALDTGNGTFRHIDQPVPELLDVQRRIVRHVLAPLGFGEAAHGGIRGRSPATNAKIHQGKRCVVKMDVKSFFPSVQHKRVYRMFRHEYGFGRDVARLLTRLVTLRGGLPQGAATSPAVANQFARTVDEALQPSLERHGLQCTRFIDDFTISGDRPKLLIDFTTRLLKAKGLELAPKKLKVCPRGGRQEVTGLVVNNAEWLSIPRAYRDAVRSAIHKLRNLPRHAWPEQVASIKGKITHIENYNRGSAARLRRYLAEVTDEGPRVPA